MKRVTKTMIKDKSAPVKPTDGSVDYKKIKKNPNAALLMQDVKTQGARRLSNAMINGFEHTQVILREVETNDRSAPKILEIMPLHRNPRPDIMTELRQRSQSKDLGLKHTPNEKVKDRSTPKIDASLKVETKSKRKKKLLTDIKAVGARNLANKEIKGFEHTNVTLKEVEPNDRSAPHITKDDVTPLKTNPQPTVMAELRRRSMSSDGNMITTLTPTPEKRDRSEPRTDMIADELSASTTSSSSVKSPARRELLVDIKVKANRKLSNAAIKGFEGVTVLREVDGKDVSDKSAPVVVPVTEPDSSSAKSDSKTNTTNNTKKQSSEEKKITSPPAPQAVGVEDSVSGKEKEEVNQNQGKAKKAGILAAIILILTCAACFTRKSSSKTLSGSSNGGVSGANSIDEQTQQTNVL